MVSTNKERMYNEEFVGKLIPLKFINRGPNKVQGGLKRIEKLISGGILNRHLRLLFEWPK